MKLSILIPSNRSGWIFERCINSILKLSLKNTEVIVCEHNPKDNIKQKFCVKNNINYIYTNGDLNDVYYSLFKESRGEYIFILEDDDFINSSFKNISLNEDIHIFNYIHENSPLKGILYNDGKYTKDMFLKKIFDNNKDHEFQFSQIIFKKELLNNIKLPDSVDINNDLKIFKSLNFKYIKTHKNIIFTQTTDGKDNISFEIYNK